MSTISFAFQKDHWVRHSFNSCNFSIIFRGRGEFHRLGKVWPITAPCVLTQWPGEYVEYGPFVPEETWDEFYLIYEKSLFSEFKKTRLVDPERPVWPIHHLAAVMDQIGELNALSQSRHPHSKVDHFDRGCERLILETLVASRESPPIDPLQRVIREFAENPGAAFNIQEIASRLGLSESSFRRRWMELHPTPPHRYILELRLQQACRLLVETDQPVYEIAHQCGFEDELYFSRRFRLQIKLSPRDYRRSYKTAYPS
ncbi:MAG: helix-turn-helix domain-containing protein [Candidatus Methylacidiphilales bacterium]|nr:AraC family transcriptional regulator [Candidatus Methylacidiphilales bacterium]